MDISATFSTVKPLSQVPDAVHRGASKERMKAAAKDYESVYLSSMLSQMFAGVPTKGSFHGGQAEETWRGMLISEYGRQISEQGGVGLADQVYRELLRAQEGSAS